jgi:LacI family transcriptional regulator
VIAHVYSRGLAGLLRKFSGPVVNVASVVPDLPFPRVSVNHELVGRLAYEHLHERGLEQFGFVGHSRHVYSLEREAGFRRAIVDRGQSLSCYYERAALSYQHRGRLLALDKGFQHWLRTLPKPVGIFACHDVFALQVTEACRLNDVRVPEEVAILGVDNDDLLCEIAQPSLSSVVVPAVQVGYEAAGLLARLLAGARPPRRPVVISPPAVVMRQSSDVLAIEDREVAAALRFLREHAHKPIRVADVLREVPISRRALERKFQTLLHRGLAAEIRRVHIQRAKQLLATSELSMEEIARQSGFASQPVFSRVFHRETQVTPSSYRRKARSAPPPRKDNTD